MISTTIDLRVRYAETDQMGIVYHGNYFPWFEMARVDMLDHVGLPYAEIEAEGLMLPVLACEARFRASARFDDRLSIQATMPEMPRVRFHVEYKVFRAETLLATGRTEHAFMTPNGRPARPPERFLQALAPYFAGEETG
ncbi:MAG: acyl-CoA thioesterase [Opitutales bacterium]